MKTIVVDKIEKMFSSLNNKNLVHQINPNTHFFYDEPPMFLYPGIFSNIKNIAKKNDVFYSDIIETAGMSFFSKPHALLRCLGEAIERICLFNYKKDEIEFYKPQELEYFLFSKKPKKKIGCTPGHNLINNKPTPIPAQLTSLNYLNQNRNEESLFVNISTGTAFEFDFNSALVKSLCEVFERDSLMSIYLNKISIPQVEISTITDKKIQKLHTQFKSYQLTWHVFDYLNDFNIPVAISLLIDKSGYGPSVTVGSKCSFNRVDNIVSSAEEAVLLRDTARKLMNSFYNKKVKMPDEFKKTLFNRINLWWPIQMLDKLDFLIKSQKISFKQDEEKISTKKALNFIIKELTNKKYDAFYKDITMDYFKKFGFFVIKSIIPALQPLYIGEQNKTINEVRLKAVADYYKVPLSINDVSHPFL